MGGSLFGYFLRLRLRRWAAKLALLALLVQAAAAGFHVPTGQAAAMGPAHHAADCAELPTDPAAPAHAPEHCPFCLVLQGGKLLPPAACLIFPPAAVAVRMGLAPPGLAPPSILAPAHRPRGPPASA
jgi:hypothetical protein